MARKITIRIKAGADLRKLFLPGFIKISQRVKTEHPSGETLIVSTDERILITLSGF